MPDKGSFNQKVYNLIQQIPKGKVVSYGQVAAMLGNPLASRAVGGAMRSAPEDRPLPWHRVVHHDGGLCEQAFGGMQRSLLEQEGISFTQGGKVVMKEHRWISENDEPIIDPGS